MSKTNADDVLEFLDSLPQDKKNNNDNDKKNDLSQNNSNVSSSTTNNKDKGNDDILDFLDELEKSNLSLSNKDTRNTSTSKKQDVADNKEKDDIPVDVNLNDDNQDTTITEETTTKITHDDEKNAILNEDPLNDPISSISSWWNSSGSATVSSLWSKTTTQAAQLKDKISQEQNNLLSQSASKLKDIHLKDYTDLKKLQDMNIPTNRFTELAKNLTKIVIGDTEEVLRIHLVHDLINYPTLSLTVHEKFDSILNDQVQGGIRLFIDEWGKPNQKNSFDSNSLISNISKSINNNEAKKFNVFTGKIVEGEKLAFANLDNAINLFNKSQSKIKADKEQIAKENDDTEKQELNDQQMKHISNGNNEENEDASIIDIFISIIAITPETAHTSSNDDKDTVIDASQPNNFSFTIILKDITNDITVTARSQGFPSKWIKWIEEDSKETSIDDDATETEAEVKNEKSSQENNAEEEDEEEESINKSEWVQNWIDEGLSLALGTVAQNYVLERMEF